MVRRKKSIGTIKKNCAECGKEFFTFPSTSSIKCCSISCGRKLVWKRKDYRSNHQNKVSIKMKSNYANGYVNPLKGKSAWNTGLKTGLVPRSAFKKGMIAWNKGKRIGFVPKMAFKKGDKRFTKEWFTKSLKRRPMSSLEIKFNEILQKNNLPYKFVGNGKFWVERKNPDFINVNGEKIAIEVYHRAHKARFQGGVEFWKHKRLPIFEKYGWKVLFFDETQITEKKVLTVLKEGFL